MISSDPPPPPPPRQIAPPLKAIEYKSELEDSERQVLELEEDPYSRRLVISSQDRKPKEGFHKRIIYPKTGAI